MIKPWRNSRLVFFVGLLLATPVGAQDFASTLSARVALSDPAGTPIEAAKAGAVFQIAVDIEDAITNAPAGALPLEGWIRPVERTNLSCQDAVQSFRATRRLPMGSIDLNGSFLVSVNDDASFGIVDPRFDLATANLVKAGRFAELPADVAVNTALQTAYFALQSAGEVQAMTLPSGDLGLVQGGLRKPFAILPAGEHGVWIAERQPAALTLFAPDGSTTATLELGGDSLLLAGAPDQPIGAYGHDGRTLVIERTSGAILADFAGPQGAQAIELIPGTGPAIAGAALAFLDASGQHIDLRYLDDPSRAIDIALPAPARHLRIAPGGRNLFAFEQAGALSIIDVARSRVVQGVAFDGPIREMTFAGNTAIFLYADTSLAAVLDLDTIKEGTAPSLRAVRLGSPDQAIPQASRLLINLPPSTQALAVHRESRSAFVVDEHSMAIGAPPMSAVSLRGGVPNMVVLAERGFREDQPGHYLTTTAIPAAGTYELVLTTGIRGLAACIELAVAGDGPTQPGPREAMVHMAQADGYHAGAASRLAFSLRDGDGSTIAVEGAVVTIQSLAFSLRQSLPTRPSADGLEVDFAFPHPGPYVLSVAANARHGLVIAPILLEVSQ